MRKIQVPLKRYASPEYLRELCNRVESVYFSKDRDWRHIEAVFKFAIREMEQREPRELCRSIPPSRPPKKLIKALARVADQLEKEHRV